MSKATATTEPDKRFMITLQYGATYVLELQATVRFAG